MTQQCTYPICACKGKPDCQRPPNNGWPQRTATEPRYHEVVRHEDGTQFVPTDSGYIQVDP